VLRQVCEHWQTAYDWRATERRLNRLPHYRTAIDGVSLHFIHLRSPYADAVPLVMTHGWPGSFFEFEEVVQRLANPAAFGEPPRPAFHVVVPSLPGYGFSDAPTKPGWNIHRIAAAWADLMDHLGYSRFVALGSDWGTSISTCLALDHRDRLIGLHEAPDTRILAGRPRGRSLGGSEPGSGVGQHHVVLADPNGRLVGSAVLGEHRRSHRLVHQTRWRQRHRAYWMHRLPTRGTTPLPPMGGIPVPIDRALG
jgi:pimeloyl-ACP methyl ester carboxylesterase